MSTLHCSIVRGGTSKGVFLSEADLPGDLPARDRLLLALMGSADARQVDGLGGGDPLTSKVAIVARGETPGADLEYESVEVGLGTAIVNRGIMCGNLAAGVALFALDRGLLADSGTREVVSIHSRTSDKLIEARRVDGQPWTTRAAHAGAAEVALRFVDPAGAVTGRLLPLGEPRSVVDVDGSRYEISVVDAGTMYAFVRAEALGAAGDEAPAELDMATGLRRRVEELRATIMEMVNAARGTTMPARRMKVAMVAPASRGDAEAHVVARVMNTAKVHKAYAVSGGICLAAAAAVPGSVVHDLTEAVGERWTLRIRHPSGVLPVTVHRDAKGLHACEVTRSARLLMQGLAFLPPEATQ